MASEFDYINNIREENFQKYCNRNGGRGGLYDSLVNAEKSIKILPAESIKSSWLACEQLIRFIDMACVKNNFNSRDSQRTTYDILKDNKFQAMLTQMFGPFESNNVLDTLHKIRKYRNEATHVNGQGKKEGNILDNDLNAAAVGIFGSTKDVVRKLLKGLGLVSTSNSDNIKAVNWKKSSSVLKPVQTKPVQPKSVQTKPVQPRPVQTKPVQTKSVQTKPVQTKPIQTKSVQTKPVQTKSVQTKPVQTKPVQTKPIQTKSVQTKPVQSRPIQQKAVKKTSTTLKSIKKVKKKQLNDGVMEKIVNITEIVIALIVIFAVVVFFFRWKNGNDSKKIAYQQYEQLNLDYIINNEASYHTINSKDTFAAWMTNGGYDWKDDSLEDASTWFAARFGDWMLNYSNSEFSNTNEIYQSEVKIFKRSSLKDVKSLYETITEKVNTNLSLYHSSNNYSIWKMSDTRYFLCKYGKSRLAEVSDTKNYKEEVEVEEIDYNPNLYSNMTEANYRAIHYSDITKLTADNLQNDEYMLSLLGEGASAWDSIDYNSDVHVITNHMYIGSACFDVLMEMKTEIEAASGKEMTFYSDANFLQWRMEMDGYEIQIEISQMPFVTIQIVIPKN